MALALWGAFFNQDAARKSPAPDPGGGNVGLDEVCSGSPCGVSARTAVRLSSGRVLDCNDVDLRHRHHCFHSPLCSGLVVAIYRLQQGSRGDLPGEAPPVFTPATRALFPAVVEDRVPILVGLGLGVGPHQGADALVRTKVWSTVQTHE